MANLYPLGGALAVTIEPAVDGPGWAVTGNHMRVDVLPAGHDPDKPAAYITICEENLDVRQARTVAMLLLGAAGFLRSGPQEFKWPLRFTVSLSASAEFDGAVDHETPD